MIAIGLNDKKTQILLLTGVAYHKPGKSYETLFLRKKSSRPRAALDLPRVEKGEVIPENTAPKSYPPRRELLLRPPVRIRGPTLKARENSQQEGFVTHFLFSR